MNQKVVIYIILSAILLYLYYKRGDLAIFAAFVVVVAGTIFTQGSASAREGMEDDDKKTTKSGDDKKTTKSGDDKKMTNSGDDKKTTKSGDKKQTSADDKTTSGDDKKKTSEADDE